MARNRRHKLLTAALKKKLPALYTHDGKANEAPVVVKFFSPYANMTWYVIEGEEQEDGDWLFFNYFVNEATGDGELGYAMLSELENATAMNGALPLVERDCYFGDHKLGEFLS
jgi:hypothetical protein